MAASRASSATIRPGSSDRPGGWDTRPGQQCPSACFSWTRRVTPTRSGRIGPLRSEQADPSADRVGSGPLCSGPDPIWSVTRTDWPAERAGSFKCLDRSGRRPGRAASGGRTRPPTQDTGRSGRSVHDPSAERIPVAPDRPLQVGARRLKTAKPVPILFWPGSRVLLHRIGSAKDIPCSVSQWTTSSPRSIGLNVTLVYPGCPVLVVPLAARRFHLGPVCGRTTGRTWTCRWSSRRLRSDTGSWSEGWRSPFMACSVGPVGTPRGEFGPASRWAALPCRPPSQS